MPSSKTPSELIEELMNHWLFWDEHEAFYLNELAPSLVQKPESGDEEERAILSELRQLVSEKEWHEIPKIISERRANIFREMENERIAREARELAEKNRVKAIEDINDKFRLDFLSADLYFLESCEGIITRQEFEVEKFNFVKDWICQNTPLNPNTKEHRNLPDDEQISAICAINENIQVVARAGSGKTTTLVNRAFFIIKHCRVPPEEILILAFNRKAALEVRRKLLALLSQDADLKVNFEINRRMKDSKANKIITKDDIESDAIEAAASQLKIELPHVMTFHALAYSIVHPEESILYNDSEGGAQSLNKTLQQVVNDRLKDSEFREAIRNLMLSHFREDWDKIINSRQNLSKEEFLQFRRSIPRESLRGELVKSYGEKIIADFLFEHDIDYKYERNHFWNKVNYRPDFTIFSTPKSGLIIEYFGLKGDLDYDDISDKKRQYWETKSEWSLIEFTPDDISRNGPKEFLKSLKSNLESQGIRCNRLSEDEIWNRIEDKSVLRFTVAAVGFIGKCRKLSLSPENLESIISAYSPISFSERLFLDAIQSIYTTYLDRLSATGEDDFDGLMQRAAQAIDNGTTHFQRKNGGGNLALIRYLCVDEFQDFSNLFYQLLSSIRKAAPAVNLFCVGDDWQAINGFAGSDLKFFREFEKYIGISKKLYISNNYRSAISIVETGNALMLGLGTPARASKKLAGSVLVSDLDKFEPTLIEKQRHSGDIITPAVLRVINKSLADGMDVVILCRQNKIPWFIKFEDQSNETGRSLIRYLDLIRSFLPESLRERITISTAHKYKGLEKPTVIILDLVSRSYPLVHPDWVFSRSLGNSLEKITDEERRLLYVALTRAAKNLVIFTDKKNKSPFIQDIEKTTPLALIEWDDYRPLSGLTARLIVKIGNQNGYGGAPTFEIKDFLKATGYQWQSTGWPGWAKSFPAEGFKIDTLKSEIWSSSANGVDVRIFDDMDNLIAQFLINDGIWSCAHNNLHKIINNDAILKS